MMFELSSPQGWRPGCTYGEPSWMRMEGADWHGGTTWNYERCRRGHLTAHARTEDMVVSLPSAKDQDFRWTRQGANELILSERTLAIFQDARLTGFEPHPVQVAEVRSNLDEDVHPSAPSLYELRVTGVAEVNRESSGFKVEWGPCPICGWISLKKTTPGLTLVEGSWDGSDFFSVPEYPLWIFVSPHAANVIVENGLKPCVLFPISEVPFDAAASFDVRRQNDVDRLVRNGIVREEAEAMVSIIYAADRQFRHRNRK